MNDDDPAFSLFLKHIFPIKSFSSAAGTRRMCSVTFLLALPQHVANRGVSHTQKRKTNKLTSRSMTLSFPKNHHPCVASGKAFHIF